MKCTGCKYNRDLELADVLYCTECRRAYKKDSEQHNAFKDRYEKQLNAMEEIKNISSKLPEYVLEDINRRIGDWLASGGKEDDPYIEQQLRYAKKFI